jgi:transketolase
MAGLTSMRRAYGRALRELGEWNPDVVVLSADVSTSDMSIYFQEAFPNRFFNVGIAEQCLVDVAAGMASEGKIPFANSFAFLLSTRALEMVRTHLCYGGARVKLMAAYAGLSDSFDGPTHHSVSDIAIMRSLPNITVITPGDALGVSKLLPQVADWPGPVYFRLNRNEVPSFSGEGYEPRIGKAVTLRSGPDVTLIGMGIAVNMCLQAAAALQERGVHAKVLEMHTVKPLDEEEIIRSAHDTGALVTAEEHSIIGGLGGAVSETTSKACPVPVIRVGIPDRFAESGPYEDLLRRYGLSVASITEAAMAALRLKGDSRACQ